MRTNKMLAKIKAGEKVAGLQIPFCSPDLVVSYQLLATIGSSPLRKEHPICLAPAKCLLLFPWLVMIRQSAFDSIGLFQDIYALLSGYIPKVHVLNV